LHEFDSPLLYIHPPLAIAGYIFIVAALFFSFTRKPGDARAEAIERKLLAVAWLLTGLGLITGMLWAQLAWGRYWGWDPKEATTLFLFTVVSLHFAAMLASQGSGSPASPVPGPLASLKKRSRPLYLIEVTLIFATITSPIIAASLH